MNNNTTPRDLNALLSLANSEEGFQRNLGWFYNKDLSWLVPFFTDCSGLTVIPDKESIETLITGLKEFSKIVNQNEIDDYNKKQLEDCATQRGDWDYANHRINDLKEPIKLAPIKETPGFVYLLQAGCNFKIGRTNNVEKRLRSLQTGNAEKIMLLKSLYTQTPGALEIELHQRYREYRINGEWFQLPDFAVDEICDID